MFFSCIDERNWILCGKSADFIGGKGKKDYFCMILKRNPPRPSQREGVGKRSGHYLTNHPYPSFGKRRGKVTPTNKKTI